MPTVTCSVVGCHNSTYQLNLWRRDYCDIHKSSNGRGQCTCQPPFQLLPFPTKQYPEVLNAWITNINRLETADRVIKSKTGTPEVRKKWDRWEPCTYDRICSIHFVDAVPSTKNPYPTLHMGHNNSALKRKVRKPPSERTGKPLPQKKVKLNFSKCNIVPTESPSTSSDIGCNIFQEKNTSVTDHSYSYICCNDKSCDCICCFDKQKTIQNLLSVIQNLKEEIQMLNEEKSEKMPKITPLSKAERVYSICTKDDGQMKFYTGLPSREHFQLLYEFLFEKVKKMPYWRGRKNTVVNKVRHFVHSPKKFGQRRKLTIKSELLLTMMKLRLGLLNKDLADRFGISSAVVSSIFNTWVKVLASSLKFLIHYPDKISVRENLPNSFAKLYPNTRCILDCTEFFIDRPRDLFLQAVTWSDYKKHNTAKVLIGITPRGSISIVSDTWGGRASDRHITLNSDFMHKIDMGDQIMADKGFLIGDELMLKRAELVMPPGARGHDQMSGKEVKRTKQIANLRIHVERAIQRLKGFRILKHQLPLTHLPILDSIVVACAALCNLYPPLVK